MVALAHQAMKQRTKLGKQFDSGDPGQLFGLIFSQLVAFPGLGFGIGLAQEKNLALILFMRLRIKQEHRFFLFNARQVKQVRILAQQQRAVGVGRQDVVGVNDDQ